ncbi:ermin [Motacilla alba alba]|uniref:ermin n=1 Tax=Motacilla alba alba TaxID=1094192 RepID=UPI0018D57FE6|nr:ermin [Motacilla alba alba]
MTEEAPAAATMPACNGSLPPEDGPLQVIGGLEEIAKSLGTVPYANAETSPDTPPAKENPEESRNSLPGDVTPENFAGEKRCQEKREESAGTPQQGPADIQDAGTNGQGPGEGPGGTAGTVTTGTVTAGTVTAGPGGTVAAAGREVPETPPGSAEPRGNAAEEEEEEEEAEEEEDTEEDEVQVIEIKKESGEASRLQQRDGGKQPAPPGSPGRNSPLEKPGEQPSLGKKNDISRHSYSRYNTISYRRIRKGNTKQRIDEFESMMHL